MDIFQTKLWNHLEEAAKKEDSPYGSEKTNHEYISSIKEICKFGTDRSKTIRDTFPMFTLHDETHICNVIILMEKLLGSRLEELSRDEAAMLILSACCHDIGMSCSESEKEDIRDSEELNDYLENHHSEYIIAYKNNRDEPDITDEIIRNFVRTIHHKRISPILKLQSWPGILGGKINRDDLIAVCSSHGENTQKIKDLKITEKLDCCMCAVLLRLADILDFDSSRTPKTLYDFTEFSSSNPEAIKSREEWNKHLSSNGFDFPEEKRNEPYPLLYSAECTSIQVEQSIKKYLAWVDSELTECAKILSRYSKRWENLILPSKVESEIKSEGYLSGEYHLTLDQNRVLELFAGENLYNDPTVFVRELLQNAIDAVRTRKEMDRNLPISWEPEINIRTWVDSDGYYWFRIEDNGIGMTEDTIKNYFLKIGRSYYSSPEFEKDKISCRANPDYKPISQFGIGILSCFIGDNQNNKLELSTKRFSQNSKSHSALRMSMHGMSGYYYLAKKAEHPKAIGMAGYTEDEKKPYRKNPGTAIAIRTNLYQFGEYNGFKEIVDKYLIYPPVKITYKGPDGEQTYTTENECLEKIYNTAPTENINGDGCIEYTCFLKDIEIDSDIPSELLKPESKITVKCVHINQYVPKAQLKGFIVTFHNDMFIFDNKISIVSASELFNSITLHINKSEFYNETCKYINTKISYHFKNQGLILKNSFNIKDVLNSNTHHSFTAFTEYCSAYYELPIDTFKGAFESIHLNKNVFNFLRIKGYSNFTVYIAKNKVFPKQAKLYNKGFDCLEIYNGITVSKQSSFTNCPYVLFLKDHYKPAMNLARTEIVKYDLKFNIEMSLTCINNHIFSENMPCEKIYNNSYQYDTVSAYLEAWNNMPHIHNKLLVRANDSVIGLNEIRTIISNGKTVTFEYDITHPYDEVYYNILYSVLIKEFSVAVFCKNKKVLLKISPLKENIFEKIKNFLPLTFLSFEIIDEHYFDLRTRKVPKLSIVCCNINHNLSKWIIKNYEVLQAKAPIILNKLVNTLKNGSFYNYESDINEILSQFKKIHNLDIEIPDSLFLTDYDSKTMYE